MYHSIPYVCFITSNSISIVREQLCIFRTTNDLILTFCLFAQYNSDASSAQTTNPVRLLIIDYGLLLVRQILLMFECFRQHRYTPAASEVIKFAWIQYLSFFAIVAFLLYRMNSYIFQHQVPTLLKWHHFKLLYWNTIYKILNGSLCTSCCGPTLCKMFRRRK